MMRINIPSSLKVNEEQFEKLAIANRDLRLERNHAGVLIVMPPTGGETGISNSGIVASLWVWNDLQNEGKVFDSSTGFRLPNSAILSPDASWVSNQKWNSLTREEKQKYPPICPEFVIELRSRSDTLNTVRDKMLEYQGNGLLLGWLIDPINKKVEIYRQGKEKEILDNPVTLSGETVLVGFSLDLTKIW